MHFHGHLHNKNDLLLVTKCQKLFSSNYVSRFFKIWIVGSELVVAGKLPNQPADIQSDAAGIPTVIIEIWIMTGEIWAQFSEFCT